MGYVDLHNADSHFHEHISFISRMWDTGGAHSSGATDLTFSWFVFFLCCVICLVFSVDVELCHCDIDRGRFKFDNHKLHNIAE